MRRKICVITGSRAEYGILKPLLDQIKKDKGLRLQLAVTGMHLSLEFGLTYRNIEKDGYKIDEKIDIGLASDTTVGICESMSLGLTGFARAYQRLKPDIIVVLGDRFEIFSAVTAALISAIPVAHISAGELSKGAFDDSLRHCITKMSYMHFTAAEEYRNRVIQLGEDPKRVFNVGALGLDNLKKLKLLGKAELEKRLKFKFWQRNLLVTFHPVTLEKNTSARHLRQLLEALDELKKTGIIFTKANADTYGRIINSMIDSYVARNKDKAVSFASLGQLSYLSTMQFVDAVVGNSSSGIIEAPSFNIGTINIGDRQEGRIKPKSVIDCLPVKNSILAAFKRLYSRRFKKALKKLKSPYTTRGNAAKAIKARIKKADLSSTKKDFYDITC